MITIIIVSVIIFILIKNKNYKNYKKLESKVLKELEFSNWDIVSYFDECAVVNSRQALEKYDVTTFFKENREKLAQAENTIKRKKDMATSLRRFLENNNYKSHSQYNRLTGQIYEVLKNARAYRINIKYISSAGNNLGTKEIIVEQSDINKFKENPALLMGKDEYNQVLSQKQYKCCANVNNIIDYANEHRGSLVIMGNQEQLDNLIMQLRARTDNIKKIKTIDSKEWGIIENSIVSLKDEIENTIKYGEFKAKVLKELGLSNWNMVSYFDECVVVNSRQTLEKYDLTTFFKNNREKLVQVENAIKQKLDMATILRRFLKNNNYKFHPQYYQLTAEINDFLSNARAYRINVKYISSVGNYLGTKEIIVEQPDINRFKENPALLMSKDEYNQVLSQKQYEYYAIVNDIIDYANEYRDSLVIMGSQKQLDNLITQLLNRTDNIKKIKTIDSKEWDIIENSIIPLKNEIEKIVSTNQKILAYYESPGFLKIKETCEVLMSTQREFNEYINEKVQSISHLFGTRVIRNETINDDEYNYIRPYKKTITPFTAEVSKTVFESAENKPLEYVVKYFYPNKESYPEQIQKLYQLVEELETLKDAKQIIENYKVEYQQYLGDVPHFIMENDETGFYSRLGFANIDESVLTVEYRFSYTSGGGMAHRSFTVPMTEETIIELIKALESKLTASAFAKEQRTLMTKKLREFIKNRDNFTCCNCGNSIYAEPNLLLEIDHIIPVSKGGHTVEDNLQTLCWRCNRTKSNKIIN